MSTASRSFTRRAFIVGSAAVAGGVVFGIYKVNEPPHNPLVDALAPGEATFNPWVKIDNSAVTLITPHTDLGQGANSMQATLIAEELDIEFGQFETSFGVPSAAYYNTAAGGELAPFMSTDESFRAEAMRSVMSAGIKMMGLQSTGGSSSVPDSWVKLRTAGAVARETLKAAASAQSGVPVEELTTSNGAVHLPDGTTLAYTELAAAAADIEPVQNVTLREPNEWRLIGKPMQRLDIVPKSTGTLKYGIDVVLPDMVHATVKMSPRRGALSSFDASKAESMRGVVGVHEIKGGLAVVADNTWRAFRAADAIECTWGPGPYPAEMDEHWDALRDSFDEAHLDRTWREDGDVALDSVDSDDVVEAEYYAPYVAHQPLEPLCLIIHATDERIDVWTASQFPRFIESHVAEITGYDVGDVYLHNQWVGGSFGHRLEHEHVKQAAEVAIAEKGRPVKLTYSREEDFAQDFPRQLAMCRGRGAVRDGRVVTYDIGIAMPTVMGSQMARLGMATMGPDGQMSAGAWNAPYAIPNFRMNAYLAPELAPISSWRSVGASTNGFFAEAFLDELIHAAGADPLEERLRLVNDDIARHVLERVGEMSSWGGELGDDRGRGVALVNSFGVPCAQVVEVTRTDRGTRIDRVFVAADVGRIIDPINFDNHVKGGVIWGLGHAMNCEITYSDGMAQQLNYHAHDGMRLYQCPEIEVAGLENSHEIRGIGEPPVPPAAPALASAIFSVTGQRLREMPFQKHVNFV